ncbi:TonB family protein [Stenotrophomonas sp. YAU14A_MKIMI4_1]|uniref:TonB family protein n=1 Tax=Stenotrophomonas sp. YAU14A_MKIMI4_1 TaxID=2072408 RepID=UPI000D541BFF|nr:TonB family protein [Stenotrophomonas sp. YAU14A_MKIMI4_1]AWH27849.1 energy transducer TonB [Stenotrophomonas sp. YAU14A_MKIMI4_1]
MSRFTVMLALALALAALACGAASAAASAETPAVTTEVFVEPDDNAGLVLEHAPATLYAPLPRLSEGVQAPPLPIVVAADVDATGVVTDVLVELSSRLRDVDRAAFSTINNWRFEPVVIDGVAVPVKLRVKVQFLAED